jgi:hypothetical protein
VPEDAGSDRRGRQVSIVAAAAGGQQGHGREHESGPAGSLNELAAIRRDARPGLSLSTPHDDSLLWKLIHDETSCSGRPGARLFH